jgi:hypothetical protein
MVLKKLKSHPSGQNPVRDRRLVYISDTTKVRSIIVSQKKRRTNSGSGGRHKNRTEDILRRLKAKTGHKSTEKAIAAAVEKKVEAKMKALADSKNKEGEAEAFIILCIEKYATGKTLPPKATSKVTIAMTGAAQATFLKSILHQAKNTQS